MWLFLLFSLTTANREADKAFFSTGFNKTYLSYLPALPCSQKFPTLIRDIPCAYANTTYERIYPLTDTRFRITFNPFRCDTLNHLITIAIFNEYEAKRGRVAQARSNLAGDDDTLQFNVKSYLSLHRDTIMKDNFFREITYKLYVSGRHPMLIDLTTGTSDIYVAINGSRMLVNIFEENSKKIQISREISAENVQSDLHYFAVIASEYDTCATFISLVDENFPAYVTGMPVKVNGTIKNKNYGRNGESTYTSLYVVFSLLFVCGLIYMCLIPATLRLIHPDLRDLKHRMQELLEDDDSMVTMDIIRAAVDAPAPNPSAEGSVENSKTLQTEEEENQNPESLEATTVKAETRKASRTAAMSAAKTPQAKDMTKASSRRRRSVEPLLTTQPSDDSIYNNNNNNQQLTEEPTQQGVSMVTRKKTNDIGGLSKRKKLAEEPTQQTEKGSLFDKKA